MLLVAKLEEHSTPITNTRPAHAGQGFARGHFGEMLRGSFRDCDGSTSRGLVTLRCSLFQSGASWEPTEASKITIHPPYCGKARQAAENTLAYLGLTGRGGHLTIKSKAPVGIGTGSSTIDVVATIHTIGHACDEELASIAIAWLAVSTETAIDPVMLHARSDVLFAHRQETAVERFVSSLPQVRVVGFADGGAVDTVAYPPPAIAARRSRAICSATKLLRQNRLGSWSGKLYL
jgi:uncharacterized protein involved in propanediol utilization